MKLAIMQPYIFPYIGYFHLIESVDKIIFYDDVNFIKKGYINRNNILINNKSYKFCIPIEKISQNRLINQTHFKDINLFKVSFLKTIKHAYNNAPYFKDVFSIIEKTFDTDHDVVSQLCIHSICNVYSYLNMNFKWDLSSTKHASIKGLGKTERLINITLSENCSTYINPIGGVKMYNKDVFKDVGVTLLFNKSKDITYKQFDNNFVPNLSIIDILMFNDISTIRDFLLQYTLL
jgi:hypothetical protein